MPWTTSARYALSPQFTSCSRTPEMTAVVQLKIREKTRRRKGSLRRVFQPDTRSKPSSSLARSCGISAGSSWRSASIVTMISPRASRKPAWSAAALPKFRRSRTTTTFACSSWSRGEDRDAAVGRAVVDEDDLERLVPRLERGRDLGVELLERALLVEQGNDDRDHDSEGIGVSGRRLQRGCATTTTSGVGTRRGSDSGAERDLRRRNGRSTR